MTQDEVFHMAIDAGATDCANPDKWGILEISYESLEWHDRIERFAALVAAHEQKWCVKACAELRKMAIAEEREECAKVCDSVAQRMDDEGEGPTGYIGWVDDCASNIRARGGK